MSVNKVILDKFQFDAFWSKVDIKDDPMACWEWLGARKPRGYGNVRINKKYQLAHRVAWEVTNFEIPQGFVVCHTCDNPSCCNPSHLMLGTMRSNTVDMIIKNRQGFHKNKATGVRNANAKLSWCQVIKLREEYSRGDITISKLARKFSMSSAGVSAILKNQTRRES